MEAKPLRPSSSGRIPEGIVIPEGRLLLAFSGGSDSLFLMSVLSRVAPERTEALYVDHSLRPRHELDDEIMLNKENAERLGIPLRIERIPEGDVEKLASGKGIGLEAAARTLRYSILRRVCSSEGFSYILTAHHREDQDETVLMRILSGAPFYAYQGILEEDPPVFRPMLSVPKRDILAYLADEGLSWSEDSTNEDTGYLRNSIRHCIMPMMTESCRESLSHIASAVADFRHRFPPLEASFGFYAEAGRAAFLAAMPFQREEFIYRALSRMDCPERIPRTLAEEARRKAEEGKGSFRSCGAHFIFTRNSVRIYPEIGDCVHPFIGKPLRFCGLVLESVVPDALTLVFPPERFVPPVIMRTSREGDIIHLRGGRKRVSELEKNMHLPYSFVLEDRSGIAAVFARILGGRDRLAERFLDGSPEGSALAISMECSYIQEDESYGR